jgi:hypothetical protein
MARAHAYPKHKPLVTQEVPEKDKICLRRFFYGADFIISRKNNISLSIDVTSLGLFL